MRLQRFKKEETKHSVNLLKTFDHKYTEQYGSPFQSKTVVVIFNNKSVCRRIKEKKFHTRALPNEVATNHLKSDEIKTSVLIVSGA